MKLKTLKDLTEYYLGLKTLVVAKDELKQEAIKWVKDCDRCELRIGTCNEVSHACPKCNWITIFFNITEEDLK